MGKFIKVLLTAVLLFSSISLIVSNESQASKYNMSYLYFGTSTTYEKYINKTNNSLDTVSPSYFDLHDDGSLDEKVDPNFVASMHEKNIRVVPFLSNHWDREKGRKALANKEALTTEIADAIIKYNLDGINVDFENLTEVDRDSYTEFVKLLREKLPKDKEVSVAVAAKTYDAKTGWHASYDYAELAKYSDYLMLMTYDESYPGSEPGPVASSEFVEKSIQYALEYVPAEKIVLGIPFYGRYWKLGSNTSGGHGIQWSKTEELIKKYNGQVYFSEDKQSPYAIINIPYGYASVVHGRTLTSGKYIIWYENDESIKLKLKLVQKYNLKGTGSWSLSGAPDSTWSYYSDWLNGKHYFLDAENHWAESDINSMQNKGWMVGTDEHTFSPNKPLTRAQGAVVLVRALGLSNTTFNENTQEFQDVPNTHWAYDEIQLAYEFGMIKGIQEDNFDPDAPLTRAQMVVMLSRILDYNDISVDESKQFADVNIDHWAYSDVNLLAEKGVVSGYSDGLFYPNDNVTRAQMAALMNRISVDIERISNMD